tara:strand:- start:63166 stop:64089 length:924 start_codon:yes stop_codon:yes gene_type:complete
MFKPAFCIILLLGFFGISQNETYTVSNIGLNDKKPHFGLSFDKEGGVLFTSYLVNKNGRVKLVMSGDGILSLYSGKITEKGEIEEVETLLIDENEDVSNITSASYSPNGKYLYVTTTYENRKNKPKGNFKKENFHIEIAEFKNGIGWTNFSVLPFCEPKYSYAHPVSSPDGKALYFIANIRGGKQTAKGASDIFKVEMLGNETYSEPINLGGNVNSYSKEMFPFIGHDNTLYFASNRPGGFGGFDIYKCPINADGTYGKAEKMPNPINSKKDDFCFVIDAENKTGYFTSKRDGGKGDDDIYYFELSK